MCAPGPLHELPVALFRVVELLQLLLQPALQLHHTHQRCTPNGRARTHICNNFRFGLQLLLQHIRLRALQCGCIRCLLPLQLERAQLRSFCTSLTQRCNENERWWWQLRL